MRRLRRLVAPRPNPICAPDDPGLLIDGRDGRPGLVGKEAVGLALLATSMATILALFGPRGVDLGAHLHLRSLLATDGLVPWDGLWYAGRYSFFNYSLLFYPLASVFGVVATGVASVGIATLAFSVLARRALGTAGRWSSRTFAVVWPGLLVAGELPFAAGMAFAFAALVALQHGRRRWFLVLCLLCMASSPLAFLFLCIGLIGIVAVHHRGGGVVSGAPVVGVILIGLVEVVVWRLFADGGRFPYGLSSLVYALVFSSVMIAVTRGLPGVEALGWASAAYAGLAVAAFIVPSSLGANVERLELLALPIVVAVVAVRRWRPVGPCLAALALGSYLSVQPLYVSWATAASDASASQTYWDPAIEFLHGHSTRPIG